MKADRLPSRHMTFIQRRINVDATSCRLYNVTLTSMQRHGVLQRRINVDATS